MKGSFPSLIALLLVLPGCYHYVPSPDLVEPVGVAVRAHLDPPAPVTLGEITVRNAVRVDGEFVRSDDQVLVLSATQVWNAAGEDFLGQGFTVQLPAAQIVFFERRELSKVRTALVTGTGLLVAGLSTLAVSGSSGGDPDPGGGARR